MRAINQRRMSAVLAVFAGASSFVLTPALGRQQPATHQPATHQPAPGALPSEACEPQPGQETSTQVGPHGPGSVPGEAPPVGRNPAETPPSGKLVAFPHPLITEVLYAVPVGAAGDANRDGNRSATGDEFIELTNPHDKPIELRGYRLRDALSGAAGGRGRSRTSGSGGADASQIDFTFPALTLQPGEVVVVFNGFESELRGDIGTRAQAAGKHAGFGHAYVFTMACTSTYQALSNSNDSITLLDPQGRGVQRIAWDHRDSREGEGNREGRQANADKQHAEAVALEETAPRPEGRVEGSVARRSMTSGLASHMSLAGSEPFSPGRVHGAASATAPGEPPQRYTPAETTPGATAPEPPPPASPSSPAPAAPAPAPPR